MPRSRGRCGKKKPFDFNYTNVRLFCKANRLLRIRILMTRKNDHPFDLPFISKGKNL